MTDKKSSATKKKSRKRRKRSPPKRPKEKHYGPLHRWRPCPLGEHWVTEHSRTISPNEEHPDGKTPVRGYCRGNPTHKDQLYPEEMERMAKQFFLQILGPPAASDLGFDNREKHGTSYDDLIRGWTQFWNDILKPSEPLDPDLVKALIASESGFNSQSTIQAGKRNFARGLMQVTDETRKALYDEDGELGEHFVTLTKEESYDPNLNIAAGVRWLFQKRKLAAARLKSDDATWNEAAWEYKGVLRKPRTAYEKKKFAEIKETLAKYLEQLKAFKKAP